MNNSFGRMRILRAGLCLGLWAPVCEQFRAADQHAAAAGSEFAFRLMKQLAGEQPSANVFVSPWSISTALQMVRNGTAGETRKEMDAMLALADVSAEDLAKAYR